MKAIPTTLLNMSAVLSPSSTPDSYGSPTYGTAVTLTSIYIEQSRSSAAGSLGETPDGTMKLFFDVANSLPVNTVFQVLDRVAYGGIDYTVRAAVPFCDPRTGLIHHWEVTLDGH